MGLTRTSSGLVIRDDFGSDTSANYWPNGGATLSVSGGALASNVINSCAVDQDVTAACLTIKGWKAASVASDGPFKATANNPTKGAETGYRFIYRSSTALWTLFKYVAGTATALATSDADLPGGGACAVLTRLFVAHDDIRCWAGLTYPLQASITSTDDVYSGDTLYCACWYATANNTIDYFDARTGYTVVCTGLPADWQFQATDGTTTLKATAVAGTATVPIGTLSWPLTEVMVLDAANAEQVHILNSTHADMGGGDVFAYAADASGCPRQSMYLAGMRNE